MGCTRGRGSTTRMFNYCKNHSQNPSLCINQFITTQTTNSLTPVPPPEPEWSALGSGTNNNVFVLACDSTGNVYAGGSFITAGGVTVNNVAKWGV